jgi:hypothetical protein
VNKVRLGLHFTSTPLETAGSVEKLPNSPIFSSKPLPTPPVSVESDDDVQIVDWPTVKILKWLHLEPFPTQQSERHRHFEENKGEPGSFSTERSGFKGVIVNKVRLGLHICHKRFQNQTNFGDKA